MTSSVFVPPSLALRPKDPDGQPLPWFVYVREDGRPDWALVRNGAASEALRFDRCWYCGTHRGRRTSTFIAPPLPWPLDQHGHGEPLEPPAHLLCALWAVRTLPYIATPGRMRTDAYPGVSVLIHSGDWRATGRGDFVRFHLSRYAAVRWFVGGQETPAEEARRVAQEEADRWTLGRPPAINHEENTDHD